MSNILEGRVIIFMKIATDRKALLFGTDQGDVVVKTDGDCCSSSWVEHVELPAGGFPAKVFSVEDLELPGVESKDDYEVIQVYGCKIATEKGDIVIDYRNESNGYYGGNLSWPGEYFYGGVYDQNVSTEEWTDIKE